MDNYFLKGLVFMKKTTTLMATSIFMGSLLFTACSDSDMNEEPTEEGTTSQESTNENAQTNDQEEETIGENAGEDQMDLKVGDTAIMHSNISSFEFTLNSVEMVDEVDGEMSDLDAFVAASITIKNIGDEPIDAKENAGLFEYTADLDGSGFGDEAEYTEDYQDGAVEGELAPGEEVTGTALYTSYIDDENYIRVKAGTAATGLINNAVFTFSEDELIK